MSASVSLTPQQHDAVAVDDGAYLLVAPPGSGKTEVLVRRIGRLLNESRGASFRVLALTFTNRAAENIRTRTGAEAAGEEWRLFAGTFHSFCLELLRSHGEPVGVSSNVTVYPDEDERVEALAESLRHEGYEPDELGASSDVLRATLREIDRLRADLVMPDSAPDQLVDQSDLRLDVAYASYERALDRFGALDFSGMLMRAYRLLTEDAWTARHYARLYRYILVDEAQDSSLIQYELLRALCGERHRNVFLVADRNQSIYGFAGANPTRLLGRFEDEFSARSLPLESNFRSAHAIIDAANQLATNFTTSRHHTPMAAHGGARGHIESYDCVDETAEAEAVASRLDQFLEQGLDTGWLEEGEDASLRPEQVAVLARTRFGLPAVGEAIRAAGRQPAPLRTGRDGFFVSETGRRLHDGLRILVNPHDVPTGRRLLVAAGEGPTPPYMTTSADVSATTLLADETKVLPAVVLDLLRQHLDGAIDADTLVGKLTTVDLHVELADHEADLWDEDQSEIRRCWHQYALRAPASSRTLSGFLGVFTRLQRSTVEKPGVRLLTVHAAKGQEFRVVAIIGTNEGNFPFYKSLGSAAEIDEERRNFYVAITRAARVLLLTRPDVRHTRRGPWDQDPSRFLDEMGISSDGV